MAHCGDGHFIDEKSRECEPCHHTCATCGGPHFDDCDSCVDGLMLQEGECLERGQLASCPEKNFRDGRGKVLLSQSLCLGSAAVQAKTIHMHTSILESSGVEET